MHLFFKVVGYFEDQRHFHDPWDSDLDSEFSEGEEMFDCPKRISKDNKRNASIATFTNIMKKNRSNPNKSMWNQRPILNMSGFAEISLKITAYENPQQPHGCLPQLKIQVLTSKCHSRRNNFNGSELISGFLNFGHRENSHEDHRIPLYYRDQEVYIPEEVLYKLNLVKLGCLIWIIVYNL